MSVCNFEPILLAVKSNTRTRTHRRAHHSRRCTKTGKGGNNSNSNNDVPHIESAATTLDATITNTYTHAHTGTPPQNAIYLIIYLSFLPSFLPTTTTATTTTTTTEAADSRRACKRARKRTFALRLTCARLAYSPCTHSNTRPPPPDSQQTYLSARPHNSTVRAHDICCKTTTTQSAT